MARPHGQVSLKTWHGNWTKAATRIRRNLARELDQKLTRELNQKLARELDQKMTRELDQKLARELEENRRQQICPAFGSGVRKIAAEDWTPHPPVGQPTGEGKPFRSSKHAKFEHVLMRAPS